MIEETLAVTGDESETLDLVRDSFEDVGSRAVVLTTVARAESTR
jgi:hypothetical protein